MSTSSSWEPRSLREGATATSGNAKSDAMGGGSGGAPGSSPSAAVCMVRLELLWLESLFGTLSAPAVLTKKCCTGIGCDVGTRSPRSSWTTRLLVSELELSLWQSPGCSVRSDFGPSLLGVYTWASACAPRHRRLSPPSLPNHHPHLRCHGCFGIAPQCPCGHPQLPCSGERS